jgi:uncharacterized membrane protein YfcA
MGLLVVLTIVGVGLAVGLLAGLVGIGGGVLIVPFLYFFYAHPGIFGVRVTADAATVLAHGTSLFVIMPTSAWTAFVYHRKRLVEWRAVVPIGLVSLVSAVAGARLAMILPAELLKVLFGMLVAVSGVRMAMNRPARGELPPPRELRLTPWIITFTGLLVGLLSALLGVGGGIVAIPLLLYLAHVDVQRVAATSIAIIAITAVAGAAAYMWNGSGQTGLPPGSFGYVHLPAAAAMFAGSFVSVRWGAALNQRLHPRTLTIVFAALFLILGIHLVLDNVADLLGLA